MTKIEIQSLEEAGFSDAQIQALTEVFATRGHSHAIDDIIGLEEQLEEIGADDDEDGDDDDEG